MRTSVLALCATALIAALSATWTTTANAATKTLTIVGPWHGADALSFQAVLDGFSKANAGYTATYAPAVGDVATMLTTSAARERPDLAVLSLPTDVAAMKTLATSGTLKSLDFALPAVKAHYSYSWQALGSVNGTLRAIPFKATNRSAIWYDQREFQKAGITNAPRSWSELLRAMSKLEAHDVAPFALGAGPVSLPNLFQNVYLMRDGGVRYDTLAAGKTSWKSTMVGGALQATARLAHGLTLQGDYPSAVQRVFGSTPKAAMIPGGSAALPVLFAAKAVRPLSQFGTFAFPRINGDTPRVIGEANVVAMTKVSDGGKALISYLTSPEAATIWAQRGGFYLSPNRGVNPSAYGAPAIRTLATSLASANVFRLPLADEEPAGFRDALAKALLSYVRSPAAATSMLAQLDALAAKSS